MGKIYGPERDFVESLLNNTVSIYGSGSNFVSRIQIEDLLTVLERVVQHAQPGSVYNVCDNEPTRLIDFYSDLRSRLGMVPPRTVSVDAALGGGIDPDLVALASASARMSNARLTSDLELELRYPSYKSWLEERLASEKKAVGEGR